MLARRKAQELKCQQTKAAGEVDREQHHEAELRRLEERPVGPAQDLVERCGAGERAREHIEVQRQKNC